MEKISHISLIIIIIFWTYFFLRNFRLMFFVYNINKLCAAYCRAHLDDEDWNAYEWFMPHVPSYASMLFSFKKLNLYYWMEERIVDKILENKKDA